MLVSSRYYKINTKNNQPFRHQHPSLPENVIHGRVVSFEFIYKQHHYMERLLHKWVRVRERLVRGKHNARPSSARRLGNTATATMTASGVEVRRTADIPTPSLRNAHAHPVYVLYSLKLR